MNKALNFFTIIFVLSFSSSISARDVVYPKIDVQVDRYMVGLLRIALNYSENKYNFVEYHEAINRARQEQMVSSGELSVLWTGYSSKKEKSIKPVHVPAYKGLMGHRIFIIRKEDQARFDRVSSLQQMLELKVGQGTYWSDTGILRAGGFDVVTAAKYTGLFYMLEGGRFDAFPRGAHEPWSEVSRHSELNLTVEENLVLKYIMPYYFYVSYSDVQLERDLTNGLMQAVADGKFDEHFYNDVDVKLALEKAKLKDRTIFTIPNPDISQDVPVNSKELWLDLSKP